jgi:hypothetical protein
MSNNNNNNVSNGKIDSNKRKMAERTLSFRLFNVLTPHLEIAKKERQQQQQQGKAFLDPAEQKVFSKVGYSLGIIQGLMAGAATMILIRTSRHYSGTRLGLLRQMLFAKGSKSSSTATKISFFVLWPARRGRKRAISSTTTTTTEWHRRSS